MVRATIALLLGVALLACSPAREGDAASATPARALDGDPPTMPPATVGQILPTALDDRVRNQPQEDAMGCDASKAEWMIGESPSEELLKRGAADAGAEVARYLEPGQMVTMEYHPSRLNVDLDEDGRVRAVRCG